MRRRFAPLACPAVLLTVAALAGCTSVANPPSATPAPEVLEALEYASETDMEWGAAPWSPPGWPLKVGDKISQETLDELDKRFTEWSERAVHWVDDLPFGAWIVLGDLRDVESETPWVYQGHFPIKGRPMFKTFLLENLPSHLRGRNVDHLFRGPGEDGLGSARGDLTGRVPALRERWHEPWTGRFGDGGKVGGK
ncbi:MAG: hypothetical protein F4139_05745 [Gemmatimonadetes bacterium]|nr:hypothetical protein [Gemmatimonadota bacterium]MDE2984839.1 hypothetical protein [Gemmatimonadota bacterium]MYA64995.1 hypothetical protein [Gemmatimonadota bacterium]MYH52436.1 hypothetical protein [Gemmatimonadota bacterium]MYK66395.1 hypothetical protein [Gemmatimonadota bacterium]